MACGGASSHSRTPVTTPGVAANGAVVFAQTCHSCHSLTGNESPHKQGGDLLGYRMSREQLVGFTRVMPTRPLTSAELSAVVDYILRRQRSHG